MGEFLDVKIPTNLVLRTFQFNIIDMTEFLMKELTFDQLWNAVNGGAVALRSILTLQPAGGVGDKVFPPTYLSEGGAEHKYAVEDRLVPGTDKSSQTVLLDSVASQANRAEFALLEGWELGELKFPVPYVDFEEYGELVNFDKLTVLDAPHRLADAIFRDSLLDGSLFRLTEIGRSITHASPRNATSLYRYSPTSLLFGMWDSTGPKGGLGSKFQRAYVSEIVGYDAIIGKKVGSRIDPLGIEKLSQEDLIYKSKDADEVWTFDKNDAYEDQKGKKVTGVNRPSEVNHGNIPPRIDSESGGVTISKALQTTVLSFATLRKLRFAAYSREAETAARCAISALGVAAIAYQYEMDFDLRSRCLLLPTHIPQIEFLMRDGTHSEKLTLSRAISIDILNQAIDKSQSLGISWEPNVIRMLPAPKLIDLLCRSQKLSKSEQSQQ